MGNDIINLTNLLMELIAIVILSGLIFSKLSEILKLPDVILFILAGILLGPFFLNIVNIDKFPVGNQLILTFGAAYILYDGGREIEFKILNKVKVSVLLLSTVGVFISTAVVGYFANKILGLPTVYALLLGSVIASTDPSVLVPLFKTMTISDKLKQTIISESAFNDAAGAITTFAILGIIQGGTFSIETTSLELLKTIIGGIVIGVLVGYLMHVLADEKPYGILRDNSAELVIVSVIGAYLISNKLGFSGYMSVFIVGMICGNKKVFKFWIPDESFLSHTRFKEVLTMILRMMIFILLGTHINFRILLANWQPTLLIVFILIFIARPLSVIICVIIDRKAHWNWRQIVYMMWVRETGVIPAALAGMLMTAQIPHADVISSVTFTTIILTLTLQASTAKYLAKLLKINK